MYMYVYTYEATSPTNPLSAFWLLGPLGLIAFMQFEAPGAVGGGAGGRACECRVRFRYVGSRGWVCF